MNAGSENLQVRVAAGERLADLVKDRDLRPRGHAMEVRVCAENPEGGFLPAAGLLRLVREPEGPGIRVDSGVYSGWDVPVFYDSLLAKVIVYAPDRATACTRMSQALRDAAYLGIPTNVDFLRRLVDDPDFRQGNLIPCWASMDVNCWASMDERCQAVRPHYQKLAPRCLDATR